MQFKKISELREGMRLARPIYNKNGVLLFDRDSKITSQGINSISNFGLIGLFILEPAEPCPPMTPEDIEFERFQTINVFALTEEIKKISVQGKQSRLPFIVSGILKNYGHLDDKINFNQNLRSSEDANIKHALNVAMLAAMMCNRLNVKIEERMDILSSALLRGNIPIANVEQMFLASPNIRRFILQADKLEEAIQIGGMPEGGVKIMPGGRILAVADIFDNMTAMNLDKEPESEVATVKFLLSHADILDKTVIMALVDSINILVPGVCVELSTGSKALVLNENRLDLFRPMVLGFGTNEVMDLSDMNAFGDVEILDIMKTMDNRHVIDTNALANFGIK